MGRLPESRAEQLYVKLELCFSTLSPWRFLGEQCKRHSPEQLPVCLGVAASHQVSSFFTWFLD